MSVLIQGGRIITASEDYVADVYIEDETVTLIGTSLDVDADRVIDASGKYVLPGCIDPHTHFDMPFGGTVTADDFQSGQTSCAFGGTTCHIDFAIQTRGKSFTAGIEDWHAKADGKAMIDYGFHIIVIDLEGGTLEDLATLPDLGVTSYKMLMAYKGVLLVDDQTLFRVMELAKETGALAMIHGENGEVIDLLVKRAVEEGNLDPSWHAKTRPAELEGEATNRAIQIAHVAGCPVYIVHVTCEESVDAIAARAREGLARLGRDVHAVLLRRRHVPRPAELRRREGRLLAAGARQAQPADALGRGPHGQAVGDLDRPLLVPHGRTRSRSGRTTSR